MAKATSRDILAMAGKMESRSGLLTLLAEIVAALFLPVTAITVIHPVLICQILPAYFEADASNLSHH